MKRVARIILRSVLISVVIFFGIATVLILSDRPSFVASDKPGGMSFTSAFNADYSGLPAARSFKARDGNQLAYRLYAPPEGVDAANRLIILVHGSGWQGMQFHPMARFLVKQGLGTVVVPDMRGHGTKPTRRGDIDYIAQLEDDMADLIDRLSDAKKDPQIVLGGHSSGGGFVLRFAGGRYGKKADAFILFAPFLKYNAPTTKENSGGWAQPATRRIIGLSMLNMIGISWFNYLPVISFAMPKAVMDGPYGHTATTIYTHRMNTGFGARADFEADLAAIHQPLLVIAGSADEAFHADKYKAVISAQTKTGTYHVLPKVTHLGVVTGPEVQPVLESWLKSLKVKAK
jgi:non-heme chloroperoxidase